MIIESIYQTIIDQYRITTRPSQRNHKRRRPGTIGPVEKSLTAPVQCYRLLCSRHHLSPSQLREPRIFDIERQLKFISTVNSNDGEKTIAVSDLNTGEDNRYCELSVSVESPWQHKGLAEILCKKLLEFSQHRGMKFFL